MPGTGRRDVLRDYARAATVGAGVLFAECSGDHHRPTLVVLNRHSVEHVVRVTVEDGGEDPLISERATVPPDDGITYEGAFSRPQDTVQYSATASVVGGTTETHSFTASRSSGFHELHVRIESAETLDVHHVVH